MKNLKYTQIYENLFLHSLNKQQHEKTCGYWYTVTQHGATAHTAFYTREQALRWLEDRGLTINEILNFQGDPGIFEIQGKYKKTSHQDINTFYNLDGKHIHILDNAQYTLGIITEDQDNIKDVNYLNCNIQRIIFDYKKTQELEKA